jgi:hypothetical protein
VFLADEFLERARAHPRGERRSTVDLRGSVGFFPGKEIVHKQKYGVPAFSAPDFALVAQALRRRSGFRAQEVVEGLIQGFAGSSSYSLEIESRDR